MRFYTKQHKFYCGIDLHTNKMYPCILDETGQIRRHRNIKTDREVFLKAIEPFRDQIVVGVGRQVRTATANSLHLLNPVNGR